MSTLTSKVGSPFRRDAETNTRAVTKPPLVSIGGASRSGSTLLTMLLDADPGYVAVGELRYVWSRGLRQNMLCGCGVPFRECPFWRAVLGRVYGGLEQAPAAELDALQASVSQIWHVPLLLSTIRPPAFDRRVGCLVQHLSALCDAIRAESGAGTIIDSSKLPSYCHVLSTAAGEDARLIHLVRDSRAVAFSFLRKKPKPDIHWREAYMRRFPPLQSAMDWNGLNLAMELIGARRSSVTFARYEDLVRDPVGWLAGRFPEVAFPGSLAEGIVPLEANHTVSGNPLRFTTGELRIRPDEEWRDRMKPRDRWTVTAATLPLLYRYGYL
jgi:hypothetical protein